MEISYEWDFGDDKKLSYQLGQLVLSGKKKATTALHHQGKKIPKVGEYATILDSEGKHLAVIQYTNVEVKPFLDVGYDFIEKEGEGDRNVKEWREKHRKFFGLKNDDVKVVCEEFKMVS